MLCCYETAYSASFSFWSKPCCTSQAVNIKLTSLLDIAGEMCCLPDTSKLFDNKQPAGGLCCTLTCAIVFCGANLLSHCHASIAIHVWPGYCLSRMNLTALLQPPSQFPLPCHGAREPELLHMRTLHDQAKCCSYYSDLR